MIKLQQIVDVCRKEKMTNLVFTENPVPKAEKRFLWLIGVDTKLAFYYLKVNNNWHIDHNG